MRFFLLKILTFRGAQPPGRSPRRSRGETRTRAALALLALLLPLGAPAASASLDLPAGAVQAARTSDYGGVYLPTGPSVEGRVPQREFSGTVARQAWRIDGGSDSHALMAPLRAALVEQGFQPLYDCATEACGGFDFRFALDLLPEPAMHVDLGDFRYFLAATEAETLALVVSRRGETGYVQITAITAGDPPETGGTGGSGTEGGGTEGGGTETGGVAISVDPSLPAEDGIAFAPGSLAAALESLGHVTLDDLDFDAGSTDLGAGPYASLAELAAYLKDHPDRAVALVGHTDATGGLDLNIAISRKRAQSVLARLVSAHGVPKAQLSAEGVGYLAPRRANLTEAGQTANRRVEAVLISTE